MSAPAVTQAVRKVELDANAVLRLSWSLYKRLFARSLGMGVVVFGVLRFVDALSRSGHGSASVLVGLLSIVLSFAGVAVLEGGLVEIVRGLHDDGSADSSIGAALGSAGGRLAKLAAVSLLTAFGIGFGLLLLAVPGLVLMTRWAVAVPVAMLEDVSATGSIRRSREIVRGNEWAVFKVLFAIGFLTGLVWIPFMLATAGGGTFEWWLAMTVASALTLPYSAHTMTVIYYGLVEPERPVALEPGRRWQSVWDAQDAGAAAPSDRVSQTWAEYEERFRP